MRSAMLSAALIVSGAAVANDWPLLVRLEDGGLWHAKPGSAQVSLDPSRNLVITADTRLTASDGKTLTLLKISIPLDDCVSEKGKLHLSSYDGTSSSDAPFLIGSGTGYSVAAEIMCESAFKQIEEAEFAAEGA